MIIRTPQSQEFAERVTEGKIATSTIGADLYLKDGTSDFVTQKKDLLAGLFWSSWGNVINLAIKGGVSSFEPLAGCLKTFTWTSPLAMQYISNLPKYFMNSTFGFYIGMILIGKISLIQKILHAGGIKQIVFHFPLIKSQDPEDTHVEVRSVRFIPMAEGLAQTNPRQEKSNQVLYRVSIAEAGFLSLWGYEGSAFAHGSFPEILRSLKLGSVLGTLELRKLAYSLTFPSQEPQHNVLCNLVEDEIVSQNEVCVVGKKSSIADIQYSDKWLAKKFSSLDLDSEEIFTHMIAVTPSINTNVDRKGEPVKEVNLDLKFPPIVIDSNKVIRVLELRTYKVNLTKKAEEEVFCVLRCEASKAFNLAPGKAIILGIMALQRMYRFFILSWGYSLASSGSKSLVEMELVGILREIPVIES